MRWLGLLAGLAYWDNLTCGVDLQPLKLAGCARPELAQVAAVSRCFLQR